MPYTIVYTQAPRCDHCRLPMQEWTAFAEHHLHDQCRAPYIRADLARRFDVIRQELGLGAPDRTADCEPPAEAELRIRP